MTQRSWTGLVAATLLLLLLGCNGAERDRRAEAERQRATAVEQLRRQGALVSRCRRQQTAVRQQVQAITSYSSDLVRLSQRSYIALPRPAAPDPAVLARFTRDDQELEQESYQQALARWREADGAGRQRWQAKQEGERQQLTDRKSAALAALAKLGVAASPEAQSAWSRCDGPQLMAVTQATTL